jgi:hypothetical protein
MQPIRTALARTAPRAQFDSRIDNSKAFKERRSRHIFLHLLVQIIILITIKPIYDLRGEVAECELPLLAGKHTRGRQKAFGCVGRTGVGQKDPPLLLHMQSPN